MPAPSTQSPQGEKDRSAQVEKNRRVSLAYNSSRALFSPEECDAVLRWSEAARANWKKLLEGRAPDSPWRVRIDSVETSNCLPSSGPNREIGWLPLKLREIGTSLNRQIWRFDITGWSDVLIIRYHEGHRLPQHTDLYEEVCDYKITMLLQLSPPDAYQGGDLEFGTPPEVAQREQGTLLAFPAWIPHQVTTITAGARYVAAVRALGPSFR